MQNVCLTIEWIGEIKGGKTELATVLLLAIRVACSKTKFQPATLNQTTKSTESLSRLIGHMTIIISKKRHG